MSKDEKVQPESEKIWNDIQALPINVYALADQRIADHVHKMDMAGDVLYVKLVSSAVLPALEEALGKAFTVEASSNFVIIKRAATQVSFPEKKFQPAPYVRPKKTTK
jgi:hypothetical protein